MQPSSPSAPADVAGVLSALLREPGRPRVTWYGDDGERVELSGAVLDNWVSKTTNLLVEELDAAPGVRVRLDLPPHWRSVLWALGTWRTGACAVVDTRDEATDVVVTDRPGQHAGARDLVAVALPALARSFPEPLPAGALDAAASVMTYGDQIGYAPATDPRAPAVGGGAVVAHADLLSAAAAAVSDARLLTGSLTGTPRVATPADGPLLTVLLRTLGVLTLGGSVVLLAPEVLTDPARTARIVEGEQVAAVLA